MSHMDESWVMSHVKEAWVMSRIGITLLLKSGWLPGWFSLAGVSVMAAAGSCDMTRSWVWHASFIRVWHESFTRDITHDSFVCDMTIRVSVMAAAGSCNVTHSLCDMIHASLIRDLTHDSFTCDWTHDSFICDIAHSLVYTVAQSYVSVL